MSPATNLNGLLADRAQLLGATAQAAGMSTCLDFPAVLRRRVAGDDQVVAQGPLGVIAEAITCIPKAHRNEFSIGFAFPPSTAGDRPRQQGRP